jgi:iron complex transport system substrate-binding protein
MMSFLRTKHGWLALLAWAGGWLGAGAAPVRVVSQTVGTDELLLAVAAPEQIAALSHISDDAAFSAVAAQALAYPKLERGDAESVLKYRPTLLLVADFSRTELVEQVRRSGVRVLVFDRYDTLEAAFDNLRRLARELGGAAPARAEAVIAESRQRVEQLSQRLAGVEPLRVIAPSTYGVIPGRATTFQDQCDHARAINLGATLGGLTGHAPPPNEQMLTWPIDRVVVAGASLESALAPFRKLPPYAFMPAIRENRAVLLEPYMMSTVTHHRVAAYEALARGLYPERFD